MLSFRLSWSDLRTATWFWDSDRWRCGQSWLRPFANPVVEHILMRTGPDRMTMVVREAVTESSRLTDVSARLPLASLATRPGDYLAVQLTSDQVTITAGSRGTAPVYVTTDDGVLRGSWDLATFARSTAVDRLCARAVVRTLTRRHRYSAETLHADIHRVTERATATWTPTRLTVTYPDPAPQIAHPRTLRPGADPVGVFDEVLTNIVSRTKVTAAQVAVELSGGVDSGNIAASVTDTFGPGRHSYGLIVPGPSGELQ